MPDIIFEITRKGRAWREKEAVHRLDLFPARAEMIDGKLFWTEEDRLTALALLLENVGVDKAISLGDPDIWREAISELGKKEARY